MGAAWFVASVVGWALAAPLAPDPALVGPRLLISPLRESALLAAGVAVAHLRARGRSWRRALVECLALAAALEELRILAGSAHHLLALLAGGPTGGPTVTLEDVVDLQVAVLLEPGFHAAWLGLGVGLLLGARRLGDRLAGVALVGPMALGDLLRSLRLLPLDPGLFAMLALAIGLSAVAAAATIPLGVALADHFLRARGLLEPAPAADPGRGIG